MRSSVLPTVMLLYQGMVPLLVHHQMLCYCSIAKSQTLERKTRVRLRKTIVIVFVGKNVMREISAQSSVTSLLVTPRSHNLSSSLPL